MEKEKEKETEVEMEMENSCTTSVKTRKEWYILGKVKQAEAVVPEPCKCKKFVSKGQAITKYYGR
jgi:hypothetical protein